MALTYSLTRPYLKEIDQIAEAMSEAEREISRRGYLLPRI